MNGFDVTEFETALAVTLLFVFGLWLFVMGLAWYSSQKYWRVRYRDGRVSRPMCWREARNYAEIFGGEVETAE